MTRTQPGKENDPDMSDSSSVDDLVSLQQCLDELTQARQLLDGIPDWMSELHTRHSLRKSEIDQARGATEDAERERRAAEAEAQDAQERLKHFQQQISLVRTQREYAALLQEIDTAKETIRGCEEKALEALERAETGRTGLGELETAFTELDAEYSRELEKWEAEKPEVATRVGNLEARVAELHQRIPKGRLVQFQRLYDRLGSAVAPVLLLAGGKGPTLHHCGACNYRVRPQVVVEIRNDHGLSHCDSCQRILYLPSA